MYALLLLIWLGLAAWIAHRGYRRRSFTLGAVAVVVAVSAVVFFFFLLDFWAEMLWFSQLGFPGRFWTVYLAQGAAALAAGAVGGLAVYLLTLPVRSRRWLRYWPESLGTLWGAVLGLGGWDEFLLFVNRVNTGVADPLLGLDTGFYLFTLPVLDIVFLLLLGIAGIGLLAAFASHVNVTPAGRLDVRPLSMSREGSTHIAWIAFAFLLFVLAAGRLLSVCHLLYSKWGVVAGPGWTDVHARLPANLIVAAFTAAVGIVCLIRRARHRLMKWLPGSVPFEYRPVSLVGLAGTSVVALWIVGLALLPAMVQWLLVQPNEITYEQPYIKRNIDFTRRGFKLHVAEEAQYPVTGSFTRSTAEQNARMLEEIRLWDWRALDAVYEQFQEIRLYYEFRGVDIDRYTIDDRYRQVMVSAREINVDNLPEQSQTFVNRRFKYTHGYGLTLAPVSEFQSDGLPRLLIRDIPPETTSPDLRVERPEIYYGELTEDPVVANSSEEEFDHPRGDENVYAHYQGSGGVPMANLWRKFVFGWKFDGTRFLFSTYPKAESRMLFYREVRERVARIAPFLEFDADPYIVLAEGRLYWILDGYTTSRYYPYSEPFRSREAIGYAEEQQARQHVSHIVTYLDGMNYVRNAVKAVVDAYNGSVDLYVFDPEDPLIRAWSRAFPDLFKPREDMPDALEAHIRYPEGFLLAQGLVYAKYHMNDPTVFYNQEDLWVRATEKYYNDVRPVEPYYVLWEMPGDDELQFVLMLPFTPKNRQVLIGWIAGLCDPDNYGRFLAYKFPKEKWVLGPQQVETKIDQDRHLSGQLTLWDQRGSNVIRGNVLAIPIHDTLLYVEPIYLQAETAAYPELRLVVVMQGERISYAESFDAALKGLYSEVPPGQTVATRPQTRPARNLARQANESFEAYLRLQHEKQFEEAARELQKLEDLLQQMVGESEAVSEDPDAD